MALGDVGMFLPEESQYKTPGAYDEALRAEALKRAQYLSMMDQFYAQLAESQRQFNETLGLKKDIFSAEKEQWSEEFSLKSKALEADTEFKQESLDVERMKINANAPMNYLGTSPAEKSMTMAMDMVKQLVGGQKTSSTGVVTTSSGTAPSSGTVTLTPEEESKALENTLSQYGWTWGHEYYNT